ncbi:unnamed protein product, partial [Closterium sp. Yama58-4]
MARWIANAGLAGVPLTLATIREHVASMARSMSLPPTFRCSIGWVRRALRRQGVKCIAACGEAADQDLAAVRTTREKLPQLIMHLSVRPRDTYNFDETALYTSVFPRKTYGAGRVAGRKEVKDRLTVGFLVNADGSHSFHPLVISKAKRPHDFRPNFDPEEFCFWRNTAKGWMASPLFTLFIEQLNAAMYAEDRHIVILLDNASSHVLTTRGATSEDLFGFRTRSLSNIRLVYLPPNTTCFTQPLDQGLIAMAKARYRQHWLRAFTARWNAEGATSCVACFKPNIRGVIAWLNNAWMNIELRTIQRCWWRTGCLPRAWAMDLPYVGDDAVGAGRAEDIGLDEEIGDVGILIDRLGLGSSAMPAAALVAIDDNRPTCAEPGEDPLATEPPTAPSAEMWEAPATMQAVYEDSNPETREARRYARAASEMLIGYAKATGITPRDLCALFDIRNPIIRARMERASPPINLNITPPPAMPESVSPPAETPRRRGRVLPAWTTEPTPSGVTLAQRVARRQELIDGGGVCQFCVTREGLSGERRRERAGLRRRWPVRARPMAREPKRLCALALAWWLAFLVATPVAPVNAVPLEATQVQFLQECQAAWGQSIPGWSGASPDCSSATGLTCDPSGMIVALQLRNYKLGGQIPNSLSNLRKVTYLDLASNQLPGSIPATVTALSLLKYLWIFNNTLTGSIPAGIGSLTSMLSFSLSTNQLTNSIPTDIGLLSKLVTLDLSRNQLSGSIPSTVSALAQLTLLYLYDNQLTGSIPAEVGSLRKLVHLSLLRNQLTGSIPAEIGSLSLLKYLSLRSNQLTGSIPAEIGSVPSLLSLTLEANMLSGSVPSSITKLTGLSFFSLSTNQLTNSIPTDIGLLSKLVTLDLSRNQLSGSIPSTVSALAQLTLLYLYDNQLTGSIPAEVGSLRKLVHLSLLRNQLTGSIPAEIGSLSLLKYLSLRSNQLTGSIPAEIGSVPSLLSL